VKYLLDSCTFLWLVSRPALLSPEATSAILDPGSELLLSPCSVWELLVKRQKGTIEFDGLMETLNEQITENHLQILALDLHHCIRVQYLPSIHKDPFDRILICQALAEGATILTPDHLIRQYPVPTLW
jgi:PIN domain nuclease of toxin-antitoxin system